MKTILVPVDFSDATPSVVATAGEMAEAFAARIVFLNVAEPEPDFVGFEPGPTTVRMAVARDYRAEHQKLEQLKHSLPSSVADVTALHMQGSSVDKILQVAGEQKADLIVMGSHGHGALYELLVGSVTNGVLKSAKCPVVVVPATKPKG